MPVWAHDMSGNADMQQSILNAHDSHFPHQRGDSHEPEEGSGDATGRSCWMRAPTRRTGPATITSPKKDAATPMAPCSTTLS